MLELTKNISSSVWLGHQKESRKSYRRKTLASVWFLEGMPQNGHDLALNLSVEGVYVKTRKRHSIGAHIDMIIKLPYGHMGSLKIGGRLARIDNSGLGIGFSDMHSRDRSTLRKFVEFVDLDDVVVSLQGSLKGILSGNLLPASDWCLIEERLKTASERKLKTLIARPKDGKPIEARLEYADNILRLRELKKPLPKNAHVIYVVILDGPLHAVFEGLIWESETNPRLILPERMYHNDRRWSERSPEDHSWMVIDAPHLEDGQIRLPVLDLSEGGCSIQAHKESLLTVGMRFPCFAVLNGENPSNYDGATIMRLDALSDENWLVGLNFIDTKKNRDTFAKIQNRSLQSGIWTSIKRMSGLATQRIRSLVETKRTPIRERVFVVHYKNNRGDTVAALLDATFDLNADPSAVDAVVVIAQPFPVRKEVFSLLSRTLVDNFQHQRLNAVILRFDMTHTLGESEVDPDMAAKGHPYLRWTYSLLEADLLASLAYLERRFSPRKRALVTYSVSAISARRMIADQNTPRVDHWVAPFGCPDGQDMFKNLLAGVDLFPIYLRGEQAEPFLIYGRMADPSGVLPDAIERGMAFLEDARKDMEKITIPVTWIVGTYDYMVTRERVKQMLNAPGGGIRETIEVASGHNPRTGSEAIESFKLVFESIAKHLYGSSQPAIDPDLSLFARQKEAEWARSKRNRLQDAAKFWEDHLFGTCGDREGYDVLLYNPDYVEFIEQHVKLLDIRPGMRIADIGCGTGNLSAAVLQNTSLAGKPLEIHCSDLVPAGVKHTRQKLRDMIARAGGDEYKRLAVHCRIVDLEAARLLVVKEFLSGELYGVGALEGRVEGLCLSTIRKLEKCYGPAIHHIFRGEKATLETLQELCPELDDAEAETVRELSRVSRFLQGMLSAEDTRPDNDAPETAADLHLRYLNFGKATQNTRIDFPSGAFDRVGAALVLPYLFDPLSVLKEVYRMLDAHGVLVVSSLKPNFDSSKSYLEEAEVISKRTDIDETERERLLASLREFSAFVARLIELEDEGRFKFFAADDLADLVKEAGFSNVRAHEALGLPPSAVIVRAEKKP